MATTSKPDRTEGEPLVMNTKMVVSPMAGVFQPETLHDKRISVGQIIGHIINASERIPITSPFEGVVDTITAWPDERVRKYQLLMALATPSVEVRV